MLDKVEGIGSLERLVDVLDAEILGFDHPFTGVFFKFTDPFDDFFKIGSGPNKRPQQVVPIDSSEDFQSLAMNGDYLSEGESDNDYGCGYGHDYETFESWMFDQREEKRERFLELEKVNRPLKRVFEKINFKHVHMVVDYGTKKKRRFEENKYKRYIALLPVKKLEYFRTNLRISEFICHSGQFSNLKTLHIDGLMNATPSTLSQLFTACPVLEKWTSPVPGNIVPYFKDKTFLIKNVILYNFVTCDNFRQMLNANLSLTSLTANASTCPIEKRKYDEIIRLIQDNSSTLETIEMSVPFLQYVLQCKLSPVSSVRKILVSKCSKKIKKDGLHLFPNAVFAERGIDLN